MAEGRKIADEVKKEQGVTAKKMKIGGVETEVTLKSNINQKGRFPNQNVKGSNSGGLGNALPYMPFPISALPQEAIDQIKPTHRERRHKLSTAIKEEATYIKEEAPVNFCVFYRASPRCPTAC